MRRSFVSHSSLMTIDAKISRRGGQWFAGVSGELQVKAISRVMSTKGNDISPYFLQKHERITKEVDKRLGDSAQVVFNERSYTFQRNGTPAHTKQQGKTGRFENVGMCPNKDVWQPGRPGFNAFEASKYRQHNVETLTRSIKKTKRALEANL